MTQEEVAAMRPAAARLQLIWQTDDGAYGLVERSWGDGDVSLGMIRADGTWLSVDHEFLDSLRSTLVSPKEAAQ